MGRTGGEMKACGEERVRALDSVDKGPRSGKVEHAGETEKRHKIAGKRDERSKVRLERWMGVCACRLRATSRH